QVSTPKQEVVRESKILVIPKISDFRTTLSSTSEGRVAPSAVGQGSSLAGDAFLFDIEHPQCPVERAEAHVVLVRYRPARTEIQQVLVNSGVVGKLLPEVSRFL
uniref:hypothetical protein n=1 Tax=Halolamina sp. TaxID=1940283 RepID=UPI003561791F